MLHHTAVRSPGLKCKSARGAAAQYAGALILARVVPVVESPPFAVRRVPGPVAPRRSEERGAECERLGDHREALA